jgi:general secretion pathway protein F/type IV pilus assembly protein PilC
MPDFAYVARDAMGRRLTGTLSADTEREVLTSLAGRSLFPVEIKAVRNSSAATKSRFGFGGRVSAQMMATTLSQLASLLRAGVPMLKSLNLLTEQARHQTLKGVLKDLRDRVEEGEPLYNCMARHPRVFNNLAVSMVRAGSEGGFLEDALDRVAQFTEIQEDLKGRTMGALAYPILLTVFGTIIVTVLLVFFVPKFDPLFDNLRDRGTMPKTTEALLGFSGFLQAYWWLILGSVVGLFILFRSQVETDRGRRALDLFKLRTPMVGPIFQSLAVARWCRVLGTLLAGGVPILRSMEISRGAIGNLILSDAVDNAAENVKKGETLASPLRASGRFPMDITEMILVAEESNTLDSVLVQVADGLEKRTFRKLELMVRLVEPIMLLIMAAVVLFVVMALLMPIVMANSAA